MSHDNSNPAPAAPDPAPVRSTVAAPSRAIDPARWLWLAFLCMALLVAAGVRIRLLNFPLERDEGEYAYAGQLILEGLPPYQLAYNMKLPGTYLAYAGLMLVFGQTTAGIHLGLLVVHLATLAALFCIARRLLDLPGAATATTAFSLMSLSPSCLGLAAHATHFILLPALWGLWLLLRVERGGRWNDCFWAGCLLGVAFLMKQPGVFFGLFGGLFLAWQSRGGSGLWRRLAFYALGLVLPFGAVCLWLKIAGVFPHFWFWTFSYAREYVAILPFHLGIILGKYSLGQIISAAPLVWLLAGLGLAGLAWHRGARVFVAGFLLFSVLAVCPGFYFRSHYFIVLLPAVALLAGLAVSGIGRWLGRGGRGPWTVALPLMLALLACGTSVLVDRAVLFTLAPEAACRAVYGWNPFPESAAISHYIEQNTRPDERVAVIGSEPEIYFLSHRRSATGYIYTYPLMEPQPFAATMQEGMIQEIEQNSPAVLVLVANPASWLARGDSSPRLTDWAGGYMDQNMRQVGMIQSRGKTPATVTWGTNAATVPLPGGFFVAVFKRLAPGEADDRVARAARDQMLMDHLDIYRGGGRIDEYEDIVRHHPDDAEAREDLGSSLARINRTDAAIREFQEALRLNPEDSTFHDHLGMALCLAGRMDEARQQFEEALRLQPDNALAHANLGIVMANQGQADGAETQFRESVRLNPGYAKAHDNLGIMLARRGQFEEAISQYQEALRLKPDYPDARTNLVQAQAKQKRSAAGPAGPDTHD